MDEEQLRLEYWEDNRSNREFPLWVIFKFIGHAANQHDGIPYLRPSQQDLATVLKSLETHPEIEKIAQDLGLASPELRAGLWYAIWIIEHLKAPQAWDEWNQRVDSAWHDHYLNPDHQRS